MTERPVNVNKKILLEGKPIDLRLGGAKAARFFLP